MITDAQVKAALAEWSKSFERRMPEEIMRAALEAAEAAAWQPIETAPKDGTIIDLWIEGEDDTVDFYSLTAKKVKGHALRHGRATEWRWAQKGSNSPNWYSASGIGMPLSPYVRAVAWRPLPSPPKEAPHG